jgi:magnesium and cobalt exporter, CNNM family
LATAKLLIVLALVLANGFFVAAEFSLVAIRYTRVKQLTEEGHPLASAVQRALDSLDTYLAATQLGITMSSIALGWIGEPVLAQGIEPVFSFLPRDWAQVSAHSLAITAAFTVITVLHIVLGELAPKSLALQRTEQVALLTARPLELFLFLFRPVISFLNNLGNLVLRMFRLMPTSGETLIHSIEELKLLIESSREAGLLGQTEEDMVERILHLRNQRVDALMTPRTKIAWLDIDDSMEKILQTVIHSEHSHFPVCQGSLDNLTGIVKARDILQFSPKDQPSDLKAIIRPPLLVPKNVVAVRLLEQFKNFRSRVAVVVDEYGGVQGLVTLEDVSEAILGEVPAIDERAESQAVQREDGSWLLDGMLPIDEFKRIFGIRQVPGEMQHHYRTLAGFVMMKVKQIPTEGQHFKWSGLHFEVVDMDNHRVDKVIVKRY